MNRLTRILSRNFWKLPGLWLRLCRYARNPQNYPETQTYRLIQYLFEQAACSGNVQLQVFGTENLPDQSGYMMYANHQGKFDIVAIAASCDTPFGVVMKKELCGNAFLKRIMACSRSFGMDREDLRQSLGVINNVIREVKSGRNYLIFPEGEANRCSNRMENFHHGSFRCATKTGCPVVPVALIDCFKPMDYPGTEALTVQVHYLKPILYEEYRDMSTVELANLVRDRIQAAIARNAPGNELPQAI